MIEKEDILAKVDRYWTHVGCGGKVIPPSFELYDRLGREKYLKLIQGISSFDYVCVKCLAVIPHDKLLWTEGTHKPDKSVVEWVVERHPLGEEKLLAILLEAYGKARKYRDGKRTKDRWLVAKIVGILRRRGIEGSLYEEKERGAYRLLHWAEREGYLRSVRSISYNIPYAYRKRGWRGIKAIVEWEVLEPTSKLLRMLASR